MGTDTFDHNSRCVKCGQLWNAKSYYFERMKTKESQLAEIRYALGVSGRPHKTTMDRIDVLNMVVNRMLAEAVSQARQQQWAEEAHERMFE